MVFSLSNLLFIASSDFIDVLNNIEIRVDFLRICSLLFWLFIGILDLFVGNYQVGSE